MLELKQYQQRGLETTARAEEKKTGEYIRPVVLLQAQPRSRQKDTLTFQVIKQCLVEDFKVPENEIAIATGDQREIQDVDLFDRACPIRFIITVQALKVGWDCSFAYVLCTVSEISTARSQDFPSSFVGGKASSIDVDENGHMEYGPVQELREQLALIATETGWTVPELARWIDRQIPLARCARERGTGTEALRLLEASGKPAAMAGVFS